MPALCPAFNHGGPNTVLECSGSPHALNAAVRAVRRAGVIAQVGTLMAGARALDLATSVSGEADCLRFLDEIDEAVAVLEKASWLEGVITHVVSGDDLDTAFSTAQGSEGSGKVLVSFWPDGE